MQSASSPSYVALIVAAGRGRRAGAGVPKQWRKLAGVPVLSHTIKALTSHPKISAVQLVIHQDDQELLTEATKGQSLLPPAIGGATRAASVANGLQALKHAGYSDDTIVLIHDAARPFVDLALISRTIAAMAHSDGACASIAVTDTIRMIAPDGFAGETLERDKLRAAQTPQAFRLGDIIKAHEAASSEETDDVAVAQKAGLKVALTEGSAENFKLTTAEDFIRAEQLIAARKC